MKAIIKYLPASQPILNGTHVHPIYGGKMPFAVTQDIKVGDEATIFDCGNYKSEYQPKTLPVKGKCFKITDYPNWWFKVGKKEFELYSYQFGKILGEVSPEATFVKDDEEYEIKKIVYTKPVKEWVVAPYMDISSLGDKQTYSSKYPYKIVCKVKCPCCGTFK